MTSAFNKLHLALIPAVLAVSGCGLNSVPTAEENAKAKWVNVEADYQRRADLIPNLVATVKGYAKQEQSVLTEVTNARARATSVQLNANDLTDPAKVQRFQQAQGALSHGLGRLLASVEAYPDLKSNQNFLALQSQLEGTENRINISAQFLQTNEKIGYVVIDIDAEYSEIAQKKLAAIEGTIRSRVLF